MQNELLMERVLEIVAAIFDVPAAEITAESSPETIERWDSLGRLVLTVELEQEFGVEVLPEQSEWLTSVGAIVAWLAMNGVEKTRVGQWTQ